MALKIATIASQEAMSAAAIGESTEDVRLGFNAHAFHLDIYALGLTTSTATYQNFFDKVTRIEIATANGTPEISIDSDHLHDFIPLAHPFIPYHSILTAADNIPHHAALPYPFSPFPEDPLKNFGLPAGQGIQFKIIEAADVAGDFDTFTYDLTVDGVDSQDKPNPVGYVRMVQDAFTGGAVDSIRDTDVNPAKRILGVHNFQTTSFDDLAAAAAINVTGIRTQRLSFSDNPVFEYRPQRAGAFKRPQTVASFAAAAAEINLLDTGRFFADYGYRNAGSVLGVAWQPNAEIKTIAGVASEATAVIPVALV